MSKVDRSKSSAHVELFGVPFDRVTLEEAMVQVEEYVADRDTLTQSIGVNLDQLLKTIEEPEFRDIVLQCDHITADGKPVVWMSRLFNNPLPVRITSADLMEAMFPVCEEKGYKVFFLGTKEEYLQGAVAAYRKRHPKLQIVGARNGYFGVDDEAEIVEQINASEADMLFIAISSPKKEEFVERNRATLKVPFVMGVGGIFDIAAGVHSRAPKRVQHAGFEWLWRLAQEPRRMGPRLIGNVRMTRHFAKEVGRRASGRIKRRAGLN